MIGVSIGDAFKVIELIIKGLSHRAAKGKDLFNNHIEPCYKSLMEIHTDYLRALTELREKSKDLNDISTLTSMWKIYSLNLAASRTSIKATAAIWIGNDSDKESPKLHHFFFMIVNYFNILSNPDVQGGGSTYTTIARLLDRAQTYLVKIS